MRRKIEAFAHLSASGIGNSIMVAILGFLPNHETGIEPQLSDYARNQQVLSLRLRSGSGRQILIHPPCR
jgi:hypothetical protein